MISAAERLFDSFIFLIFPTKMPTLLLGDTIVPLWKNIDIGIKGYTSIPPIFKNDCKHAGLDNTSIDIKIIKGIPKKYYEHKFSINYKIIYNY